MEEKKRKKHKKKKNRSGQPDDAAAPSTSSETPEVALSDPETDTCPAAEAAGIPPNVLQESPDDPNFLCVELRQVVQQLTTVLHTDARNSFALCGLLDNIRNAYATSQVNLDHTIEQLRGEVLHLNQAASLQKNKEVNLDGDVQHLREEILHLKVMQEAERERKAAEYVEIKQLREEMVNLSEGSVKQLRMVQQMSDIVQQLLKRGQSPVPIDSCQLTHNSAENANVLSLPRFPPSGEEPAVVDSFMPLHGMRGSKLDVASANLEKVNGHHVLKDDLTHLESLTNPPSAQMNGFDFEKTTCSVSSSDSSIVQKHMGVQEREVSAVGSTFVEAPMIQTKPVDDHGLFADRTEFVTGNELRRGENDIHQEISLETIPLICSKICYWC
ncbi:hypothetical protein GOP47_0015256 [Adiantum capillus-veneris]|uniref:Uncharacterized protein n=1 Tax=Adiantum capillus-veneris TaxID=13818 RepID=A0A9D4UJF6_ADICA|nr:hypothetical protein GOP47_0015256 [Adiantum capillus-veneris]